jgi:hypothetical protein
MITINNNKHYFIKIMNKIINKIINKTNKTITGLI